ncbi:unnamed protein product [Peniophora sp. CBMAI 1063]|nr:unnamed protein product [Peniophora sp. CBMAI 1063]
MSGQTVFYGPLVTPLSLTEYAALPRALICVSPDGDIAWRIDDVAPYDLQLALSTHGAADAELVELRRGEFLLPGFVDTHTHAPQVPNIGSGQQYELLDWLENVTFPVEAQFADVEFAKRTYSNVVRRLIDSGTTTCCYYATLHLEASKALADIVHTTGQRAFIGKCNMDRNCPPTYIEPSASSSLADTHTLIQHIRALSPTSSSQHAALVQPVLTPRFAISTTPPLLRSLGELAASDPTLLVQTHISENASEIKFTHELFPGCNNYASVYDSYGLLLRDRTVLAHAVHLEKEEVELIAERGAGIAHCPTSNFNLRSGVADVGAMLDAGINVGLGTDVSGGFSTSILTEIQHASIAAKVRALLPGSSPSPTFVTETFTGKPFSVATLLHLATLGGARVCGLASRIGALEPGRAFDALLVSARGDAGNPRLWGAEEDVEFGLKRDGEGEKAELERCLERFLFTGDDRNIKRVYVQGRWIGGAERKAV